MLCDGWRPPKLHIKLTVIKWRSRTVPGSLAPIPKPRVQDEPGAHISCRVLQISQPAATAGAKPRKKEWGDTPGLRRHKIRHMGHFYAVAVSSVYCLLVPNHLIPIRLGVHLPAHGCPRVLSSRLYWV